MSRAWYQRWYPRCVGPFCPMCARLRANRTHQKHGTRRKPGPPGSSPGLAMKDDPVQAGSAAPFGVVISTMQPAMSGGRGTNPVSSASEPSEFSTP